MKKLLLSLLIVSGCLARADTNITVNFSFTDDQWATLQEKLALVNTDLATSYTNSIVKWQEECVKAASLGKTNPPAPVLVVLTEEQYLKRFAANQLGSTKAELRAERERTMQERIRTLSPAKLKQVSDFTKSLQ